MDSSLRPTRRSARHRGAWRFTVAALAATVCLGLAVVPAQAAQRLTAVAASFTDSAGDPLLQAGAHPNYMIRFQVADAVDSFGLPGPAELIKDAVVDLPPGLVGAPAALPQCPGVLLAPLGVSYPTCPVETQVGYLRTFAPDAEGPGKVLAELPLYNMVPPPGKPARFSTSFEGVITHITPRVQATADGYSITSASLNTSQGLLLDGAEVVFWGVPADASNDAHRFYPGFGFPGVPTEAPRVPLMSNPTSCDRPAGSTFHVSSWEVPDFSDFGYADVDPGGIPMVMQGCESLAFDPSISVVPSTNLADSPAGLDINLHVPQNEDPDGLATAHVKDVSMKLPPGLTVNPSSADGLGACSPAQIGLTSAVGDPVAHFDEAEATCPNDSKLGLVTVNSPLVNNPLKGAIYLATQGQNPFNSVLAYYVAVEDKETGTRLKLAGRPVADQATGQLEFRFDDNPQLPFEDFKVSLFTGPRAALKTPMTCGKQTVASTMVPWSTPYGANASSTTSFDIVAGPNNAPCLKSEAEAPNKPTFTAGTADPTAGIYTPFVLKLARQDGTQPIKAIDTTLPKGLLGKLAGITYCPDSALAAAAGKSGKAEQASPSCPASSQVGSVTVGAGAGSNPLYTPGKAYLAGPYKGAPLSLAVITPAVAGPLDLGTVVIRNALNVDPETAKIHAVSDEIPTILQGIPLDIRSIALRMDRPQFILNPTSCEAMSVLGSATSILNQTASLSNPFQVGGCNALGFKPKLAIDLMGATKRSNYPALRATLKARPGDANIAKAVVSLPHSEFLAQNHIKTICTRVQFAANACPPGSVYGKATAWSPLLDQPLSGPVYLRSSANPLPDLVADLNGQIRVSLVGRIDSVNAGIRTSFEAAPDAPVSKFVLEMAGGKKGLLENSRNLCKTTNKAKVSLTGQNGKEAESTPLVSNDCGKKSKHKHKKKSSSKGSRR